MDKVKDLLFNCLVDNDIKKKLEERRIMAEELSKNHHIDIEWIEKIIFCKETQKEQLRKMKKNLQI